jgi:hypothetical protein
MQVGIEFLEVTAFALNAVGGKKPVGIEEIWEILEQWSWPPVLITGGKSCSTGAGSKDNKM